MQLQSEQINELASALAKAQSEMKAPEKDKKNPHFKNVYASLGSIISSCKGALNKYGISVLQPMEKMGDDFVLCTKLTHTSGQWIKSVFPVKPTKNDPQGFGSALTYSKRYSLASMLCIDADEDDDGNQASVPAPQETIPTPPARQNLTKEQVDELMKIMSEEQFLKVTEFCMKVYRTEDLRCLTVSQYNNAMAKAQENLKESA